MQTPRTPKFRRTVGASLLGVFALVISGLVSPAIAASSSNTKVKGTVLLVGKPVASAKVQLYRNIDSDPGGDGDDGRFTRVKTDFTDARGRYAFSGLKLKRDPKYGLETYSYLILITDRSGKAIKTLRVVRPKKGKTVTRNVSMRRAAILTGTANRADSGPRSKLRITLTGGEESENFPHNPEFMNNHTTVVKPDGTFRIGDLQPGMYDQLIVSGGPYATQCYDFVMKTLADCDQTPYTSLRTTVTKGERRHLNPFTLTKLAPPTSVLRGTVTTTSGKPLKGAVVRILSPTGGTVDRTSTTHSTGRFVISRVSTGSYRIRVQDPRKVWASQYIRLGTNGSSSIKITGGTNVNNLNTVLKSATTVRQDVTPGDGSVKVSVAITSKATGKRPGGTFAVSYGERSRQVTVSKGKATVRLTKIPKGYRIVKLTYSGTRNTAGFQRSYTVKIK